MRQEVVQNSRNLLGERSYILQTEVRMSSRINVKHTSRVQQKTPAETTKDLTPDEQETDAGNEGSVAGLTRMVRGIDGHSGGTKNDIFWM